LGLVFINFFFEKNRLDNRQNIRNQGLKEKSIQGEKQRFSWFKCRLLQ